MPGPYDDSSETRVREAEPGERRQYPTDGPRVSEERLERFAELAHRHMNGHPVTPEEAQWLRAVEVRHAQIVQEKAAQQQGVHDTAMTSAALAGQLGIPPQQAAQLATQLHAPTTQPIGNHGGLTPTPQWPGDAGAAVQDPYWVPPKTPIGAVAKGAASQLAPRLHPYGEPARDPIVEPSAPIGKKDKYLRLHNQVPVLNERGQMIDLVGPKGTPMTPATDDAIAAQPIPNASPEPPPFAVPTPSRMTVPEAVEHNEAILRALGLGPNLPSDGKIY
jgi:hypothetical protein